MSQVKPINENTYTGVIPDMKYFRENTFNIHFRYWYPPDENGELKPIDLAQNIVPVKPMWYLCPYNQFQNPVIEKEMIVNRTKNQCTVKLKSNDTRMLDFIEYTQQPTLETSGADPQKYIYAEGSVMLLPHINGDI